MNFLMIVDDPEIARHICRVEKVIPFVDLEVMGKAERQGHVDTWKSNQSIQDVARIREAVPEADLVVRINPLHADTPAELDAVIARGADMVMLPMFRRQEELARFLDHLGGRAEPLPLFETADAVAAIPEMVTQLGLQRVHIGLNDLHLDLGHDFLFQPLTGGVLENAANALVQAGVSFGIGGLARCREGIVSPEFLLGEHVRLGSTAAILSRTFHRGANSLDELTNEMDFVVEIARLQSVYDSFMKMDVEALEKNRQETKDRVNDVVRLIQNRNV